MTTVSHSKHWWGPELPGWGLWPTVPTRSVCLRPSTWPSWHFQCRCGSRCHQRHLPPVWDVIDMPSLFIVMSVCTVSLQALRAFQAWSSWRWMSFYRGLPALYSVGASCALCCLKFPARFSKPLTEGPGPKRDWPRGFGDMSLVSVGSQPLTKGKKKLPRSPLALRA